MKHRKNSSNAWCSEVEWVTAYRPQLFELGVAHPARSSKSSHFSHLCHQLSSPESTHSGGKGMSAPRRFCYHDLMRNRRFRTWPASVRYYAVSFWNVLETETGSRCTQPVPGIVFEGRWANQGNRHDPPSRSRYEPVPSSLTSVKHETTMTPPPLPRRTQ